MYDSMSFLNLLIDVIARGTEITRIGVIGCGAEVPVAQASECRRGLGAELGSTVNRLFSGRELRPVICLPRFHLHPYHRDALIFVFEFENFDLICIA